MSEFFVFKHLVWLWAVFLVGAVWLLRRRKRVLVFIVPFAARWSQMQKKSPMHSIASGALVVGIVLLTLALARPQKIARLTEYRTAPCDVIIAIDGSLSMLATDYELEGRPVSRLELLKPIIEKFIAGRPNDRIGIVVFSGRAYTLMAPTFNHARLIWSLHNLKIDHLPEGTAIGDGVALALTSLMRAPVDAGVNRPRFAILVSDGSNNAGIFSPAEAISMARQYSVPLYTIAIGNSGYISIPYTDEAGERQQTFALSEVDEGLLWSMATQTGGAFFRGTSLYNSQQSFEAIGQIQSMKQMRGSRLAARELYLWFAAPGLAALCLAATLSMAPVVKAARVSANAMRLAFNGTFVDHPRTSRMAHRLTNASRGF